MAENDHQTIEPQLTYYTFRCQSLTWRFWDRLLLYAYHEAGLRSDELVDDAVAFACYAMGEMQVITSSTGSYAFREYLWEAITGFGELAGFASEVSEQVDELLRDVRVRQLYLEHCLRSFHKDKSGIPSYKAKKTPADEPSLQGYPIYDGIDHLPHPLCSNLSTAELGRRIKGSLVTENLHNEEVTVSLCQTTNSAFQPYLEAFKISPAQGLLVILSCLQQYIPMSDAYGGSFRADLFDRYLACKTIVLRWLEQLAVFESVAFEGGEYARVLVERLAVLNHRVASGQSFAEFLAGEPTAREDQNTDYSAATDLTPEERVASKYLL